MSKYLDKIIDNSKKTVNAWKKERKNDAYRTLEGGEAILKTQDQLDVYLFAHGHKHQAKLNAAFSKITDLNTINDHDIQIIDYGCGQGIGSIALLDFLSENTGKKTTTISDIKLIEPSKIALDQAHTYINKYFPSFNSQSINKKIEQLDNDDLTTAEQSIKFHIFSSILDMDEFRLYELCKKINKTQSGKNYFICVSPDYCSGNYRLDEFINYFKDNTDCLIISERQREFENPSDPNKPWKGYEKVFKVNL